jgi:branched-chain amino acid transport system substrate-binding protein
VIARRVPRHRAGLVGVVALALGAVAACSSGGTSSSTSSPGAGSNGTPATGSPIKIGIISDVGIPGADRPETPAAAKAAASYLNANGGFVGGHPVQIVDCNGQNNTTASAQCAQEFVAQKVIAVGGSSSFFPSAGIPVLQAAGIPFVGIGIGANDFSSPVSYPFFGTVLSGYPAQVKYFLGLGVKAAAVFYADSPAAQAVAQKSVVAPFQQGGASATAIPVPPGQPDVSPMVAKALNGKPQAVFLLQSSSDVARVAKATDQAGYTGYYAPANPDINYIHSVSAAALTKTNVAISLDLTTPSADLTILKDNLAKYAAGTEVSEHSADAFSEVMTLKTICTSLGASGCTAAGVLGVVKNPHAIPIFLGKTLDASTPLSLEGMPTHVFNPYVRIDGLDSSGALTALDKDWIQGS